MCPKKIWSPAKKDVSSNKFWSGRVPALWAKPMKEETSYLRDGVFWTFSEQNQNEAKVEAWGNLPRLLWYENKFKMCWMRLFSWRWTIHSFVFLTGIQGPSSETAAGKLLFISRRNCPIRSRIKSRIKYYCSFSLLALLQYHMLCLLWAGGSLPNCRDSEWKK